MADYRDRGGWNDDEDGDRLGRPSGGRGSSSIAYESGRRRSSRRRLITTAVVVIAVGGFAGIVWNAYRQGSQPGGDAAVPLIQADNSPSKVRPDEPGGMDVPNQDKLIYDRLTPGQNPPATVERLLPQPESPVARPEPPTAPEPESLTEASPAPRTPVTQSGDLEPPAVTPRPAAPAAQPPAPAKPQSPPQVASIPPASGGAAAGGFRIQLGAVRTQDAAKQEWTRLQKANKDLLGGLNLNVSQANLKDRGTLYRIQAGPVGDRSAATDLCSKLKARNVSCFIVRP